MTDNPYDKHYLEALKIMDQEDSTWAALYQLEQDKKEQTMLQKTKFPHLQPTVNRDDYNWLEVHAPEYLESVEREVNDGKSPEQIYRFLLNQIGTDRAPLARRCLNAARWIKQNKEA